MTVQTKTSRLHFLRQLGVTFATGIGAAAFFDKRALAGTGTSTGTATKRWPPISTPDQQPDITPYCCLNNTDCIGTCDPGTYLFYCSCPTPYCTCHALSSCYRAPC